MGGWRTGVTSPHVCPTRTTATRTTARHETTEEEEAPARSMPEVTLFFHFPLRVCYQGRRNRNGGSTSMAPGCSRETP